MAAVTVKHEDGMMSSINVRGHRVVVDVPAHVGGGDRGPTPLDLLTRSRGACFARWCGEHRIRGWSHPVSSWPVARPCDIDR